MFLEIEIKGGKFELDMLEKKKRDCQIHYKFEVGKV